MSLPRMARISVSESFRRSLPRNRIAASRLADDCQRLAFVDIEGNAVDGAVDTLRGAEVDLQILDFEQCHRLKTLSPPGHHRPLAMRGSSASRKPSPSRLTASTVTDRNAAGKNTMKGFTCHSALPSAMMLPHDGIVGGVPAPIKERMDSTIMALAQT